MAGDSFGFWRFDLKAILKGFFAILILRGVSILLGFQQYVPIVDDCLRPVFFVAQEGSRFISNFTAQHYNR
ncbi:MAG: hypothetical protein K1X79_02210 [Oligoflexia bacterium]|nr:hypothetical protein [Oligoflexia bacterium]